MNLDGDAFWQDLRRTLRANQEEACERRELQEAEEELRQIEADQIEAELAGEDLSGDAAQTAEPVTQSQIDRWVERSVSADRQPTEPVSVRLLTQVDDAEFHGTESHGTESHRTESHQTGAPPARRWQAWIMAAAAFLVAPKFLIAASVIAGIAVTGALLQRTTTSLSFEQAIQLLLDSEQSNEVRASAGGRVYFDIIESIQLLQELRAADGEFATAASDAIKTLLTEMQQPTLLVGNHLNQQLTELTDGLLSGESTIAVQMLTLDNLVEQIKFGMQTLQDIETRNEPNEIAESNSLHLKVIEAVLRR